MTCAVEKDHMLSLPMALGTLGFGSFVARSDADSIIDSFWDHGGRIVDLAPSYGQGLARKIVASYIKRRGRELSIWDKIGLTYKTGNDRRGVLSISYDEITSPKSVINDLCEKYESPISCLQLHAPIPESQLTRILDIMATGIDNKTIHTVGVANHNGIETQQLVASAASFGITIKQSQVHLNLLEQRAKLDLLPTNLSLGIESWANRVLARGALLVRGSQTNRKSGSLRLQDFESKHSSEMQKLGAIFGELTSKERLEILIAWPFCQPSVRGIVIGASSPQQMEQLVNAVKKPIDRQLLYDVQKRIISENSLRVTERPEGLFDRDY